ncbi:MAG: S1 RNA-binding domain-containing protein [Spirochaetales bacterium]|nr:S1 RNA-binding domain-containing protein [Spirochaetales bacterium]
MENFEDLIEKSFSENIKLEPGQQVTASICSISADCIFLDLGGKSEGLLDAAELTDKEGKLTVAVGDTVKAYFISSKNGEPLFTTKISGDKANDAMLENAFESGIPVEGIVEKEIKGGFQVKIGDTRCFCPYSQIGLKRVENPEMYIGKQLTFKIIEYSENGRNILVSNRVILQDENNTIKEELRKTLKEDMKVTGKVLSIQDFGAFVEVMGLQALLPVSEIDRDRVKDINNYLKVGQEIEAVILNLDWKNDRISISMKKLQPDPWDDIASRYKPGSKHSGEIIRLTTFGAFVSLEPGLDGLLHISELGGGKRINHPREAVKEGQKVDVQINSIDIGQKRISLKLAVKKVDNEDYTQYMEADEPAYNPFSTLLKDKKKD